MELHHGTIRTILVRIVVSWLYGAYKKMRWKKQERDENDCYNIIASFENVLFKFYNKIRMKYIISSWKAGNNSISYFLTHLLPIHPFSTPWKHDVFRGWRKDALGTNRSRCIMSLCYKLLYNKKILPLNQLLILCCKKQIKYSNFTKIENHLRNHNERHK